MTTVRTIPNVEAMIAYVLRTELGIDAGSGLKKSPTYPAITVQRIGGSHPDRKRALDQATVQIDAWGTTKLEAFDTIAAARTAVLNMEGQYYTTPLTCQVAEVIETLGVSWVPDTATGKDRYLFQVSVTCHA